VYIVIQSQFFPEPAGKSGVPAPQHEQVMAKKSFKQSTQQNPSGLGSIIRNTTQAPQHEGNPPVREEKALISPPPAQKSEPETERPSSETGCKTGDTRKTFILKKELVEKMMDIAYWQPGKLKDHVNAAFEAYVLDKWSQPRPEGEE
jgi:hypothetical protein